MTLTAVSALLLAAAIFLLLRALRGSMLLPVKPGKAETLSVTLRVTGDDPALENTVQGLLWLRSNDTLPASIVIEDGGMSEATRRVAQLLTTQNGCVRLNSNVEDSTWESRNT